MLRKIVLGIGVAGISLSMLPLFAAFEAHVVNVTARIENALTVPIEPINFGTVFPQEELDRFLPIELSQSFLDERDADDVDYIIRQKPKCGVTTDNGEILVGTTWTGHVVPTGNPDDPATPDVDESYTIDCEKDKPENLVPGIGQTAGLLPLLCPYLSKHEVTEETVENDESLNSFHSPFKVVNGKVVWTDVKGRLARSENDLTDKWKIDLKVPCFGGYCAQDWADFVNGINPDVDPDDYTQPIENEHKVFGCNLWVEVTGVSRVLAP